MTLEVALLLGDVVGLGESKERLRGRKGPRECPGALASLLDGVHLEDNGDKIAEERGIEVY